MMKTMCRAVCLLSVAMTLLHYVVSQDAARKSSCSTMAFRQLSTQVQNEHMCLLLEQVQSELSDDKEQRQKIFNNMVSVLMTIEKKIGIARELEKKEKAFKDSGKSSLYVPRDIPLYQDCHDILLSGKVNTTGVYPLRLPDHDMILANCDMDTDGGGWTIIQKRMDGSMNFTRNWNEYKDGFGNPNSEFWIGLGRLHSLTRNKVYSLRVDLWDWENNTVYAEYDSFRVDSEDYNFRLHISGYSGTAGDSFMYHNNADFSTPDSDNDSWYAHCAKKDKSGWWFKDCSYASLNGKYHVGGKVVVGPDAVISSIHWYHWKKDFNYSLRQAEMKIRPYKAT